MTAQITPSISAKIYAAKAASVEVLVAIESGIDAAPARATAAAAASDASAVIALWIAAQREALDSIERRAAALNGTDAEAIIAIDL